jgi:hypothetical protein
LLPRFFNDGQPVPGELFVLTYSELSEHFEGVTIDTVEVMGQWRY